jgi:hypothetical protein
MREEGRNQSFEQYLQKSVVSRSETDRFLQGSGWAVFDPELGYVLGNSLMPWDIDHSSAIETVQPNGARTSILYATERSASTPTVIPSRNPNRSTTGRLGRNIWRGTWANPFGILAWGAMGSTRHTDA